MIRNSLWPPVWEIAGYLAVAGDVFDGVLLCCPFSYEISWMGGGGSYLLMAPKEGGLLLTTPRHPMTPHNTKLFYCFY